MRPPNQVRSRRDLTLLSVALLTLPSLWSQSTIAKHTTPTQNAVDLGPIEPETRLSQLTLVLRHTPAQQTAIERQLRLQQDPSSSEYHQWLSPEEFGDRFGPSPGALADGVNWLQSHGFRVKTRARSRGWIIFEGSAAQVRTAFHTEIHRFTAGGKVHFAPVNPPQMPNELQGSVAAMRGLDDFYMSPTGRQRPMLNTTDGTHVLAPGDVANIYDFSQINGGGNGVTIAVVGTSRIDLNDIRLFRSTFQLPASDPQLMLAGDDPGVDSSSVQEADADIEWAGATAQRASILYAYATDVLIAAQYVIDQNLAPILTFSFGGCEQGTTAADVAFTQNLAQQANAQGITWIAASGDAGAAACDSGSAIASQGLAVTFPASLPEVTAVGGTTLTNDQGLWAPLNSANGTSIFGYPEEAGWNDTVAASTLESSGGGASVLFPQPVWQNVPGVPANGARNVPDLSLTASTEHDPYVIANGGKFYSAGGTSIAAPIFAGILALTEQNLRQYLSGWGNINPSLYSLSQITTPRVFHDITAGNNIVPCAVGASDCSTGSMGYNASPGYDLVTGLGSLDGFQFSTWFGLATATTVAASSNSVGEGTPTTFTVTVREYNGNIPSGNIEIYDGSDVTYGLAFGKLDTAGHAQFTLTLSGGPHLISARYTTNATTTTWSPFRASTSSPVSVMVVPSAPAVPSLASPGNGATDVSVSTALQWRAASSYAAYDVYFGTTSPPPYWGTTFVTQCSPSMASGTTYYWMVVAKNANGSASSPVWSFATGGTPTYYLHHIAGTGQQGFSGDGGPAANAQFSYSIWDLARDSVGNLYIADTGNFRVRKVTPDGIITTVAGNGKIGNSGDGGPAIDASITVAGVITDESGNLYISSSGVIRMVSPDGIISTFAGGGSSDQLGQNGPAIGAALNPSALAFDNAGDLFIATGSCVRKVTAGYITTIAGQCGTTAFSAGDGGPALSATFLNISGIAVATDGSLYIADNGLIRKVQNGIVTAFAGYGSRSGDGPALTARISPDRLAVDPSGAVYLTSSSGLQVISNGILTTIAGGGSVTPAESLAGTSVEFGGSGLALDPAGNLYVVADKVWELEISNSPPVSIFANGIANGASFTPGPIAPGSIATLYGSFGINSAAQATEAPLPSVLSGLSIQAMIQGQQPVTVPLFYVSAQQVNVQIPWELQGQTAAAIQLTAGGKAGSSQVMTLAAFSPGVFHVGSSQGAVVDTLGRLVDATNPTMAGSVITIYCTGLGAVTNPPPTGAPASFTTLSETMTPPSVTIGGVDAPVLFAGLAPGSVGEYQVNVRVPLGTTIGSAVALVVSIGGVASNAGTVAVR